MPGRPGRRRRAAADHGTPLLTEAAVGAVESVFRESWGRAVAALMAAFRDPDLAEEAVQDALATALEVWPRDGVPARPAAWIVATARNGALDILRRRAALGRGLRTLAAGEPGWEPPPEPDDDAEEPEAEVPDERLRLMFTCCHPALAEEARVPLTLRLVAGLTVPEIARAFLLPEPTVAQRLVRAKRRIREAGIPFRVPPDHLLPDRLGGVMRVVYLVFTEGHSAANGDALVRTDLCAEAIRLGEALHELMPDEPEVGGLLALMLLTDARRAARTASDGTLVLLAEQDRRLWDADRMARGTALLENALRRGAPGEYQVHAAIAALHAAAPTAADTDWAQIATLYGVLLDLTGSPVVALNRAVAVAEADGPAAGLALADELGGRLDDYAPMHVTRAELLMRLGRPAEAAAAYRRAIALTGNAVERDHLATRLTGAERSSGDAAGS